MNSLLQSGIVQAALAANIWVLLSPWPRGFGRSLGRAAEILIPALLLACTLIGPGRIPQSSAVLLGISAAMLLAWVERTIRNRLVAKQNALAAAQGPLAAKVSAALSAESQTTGPIEVWIAASGLMGLVGALEGHMRALPLTQPLIHAQIGFSFCLMFIAAHALLTRKSTAESRILKEAIGLVCEARDAGVISEALHTRDRGVNAAAERALVRLLPRLTEYEIEQFSAFQRRRILGSIRGRSRDLVVTAIEFALRTGDVTALPALEALARGEALAGHDDEIYAAARHCRNTLLSQRAANRTTDVLLRPCDPIAEPGATLVRPAAHASALDHGVLLRASAGDAGGEALE